METIIISACLLKSGRRLKDLEHLRQAEAIFTDIGAEWDLSQAEKLLQVTPETVNLNSGRV
jgi:hypothetical protein